jgi:hypothetical protein
MLHCSLRHFTKLASRSIVFIRTTLFPMRPLSTASSPITTPVITFSRLTWFRGILRRLSKWLRSHPLDQQAQDLIQQSLKQSELLLAEGRYRQAVQGILWLLKTVSTAFHGLDTGAGTVQGKYFNKIAEDLRKHHKGKILDQVLAWVAMLHGYLSSPTGGGIRHGTDLKAEL